MAEPEALGKFLLEQGRRVVKRKRCERLELAHVTVDGTKVAVAGFDLGELDHVRAHELAAQVYQGALDHASGFPLLQQYTVLMFWVEDDEPHASYTLRCQGASSVGYGMSEPPNAVGQQAQLMRHIEAQARTNAGLVEKILQRLDTELDRKDKRIEQLEEARFKSFELLELLTSKRQERELEAMHAQSKERRLDDAYQTVKLLAPSVVNSVCKRFGVASPLSALPPNLVGMKAWLKSLKHEQLIAVLAACSAPQQIALLELYKAEALADEPGFADLAKNGAGDPTPPQETH